MEHTQLETVANRFAEDEYHDLVIYGILAKDETVPAFKAILEGLIEHEKDDYEFWRGFAARKEFSVSPFLLLGIRAMRRLLGLTFTAKFIERNEKRAIHAYQEFALRAPAEVRKKLENIIAHERHHEGAMIGQIKEERVSFIGNIVLGLNDGLIELTGALVGFTFAFTQSAFVALAGSITGVAAALSMASSAYMQARYEEGKQPAKAALYTGLAYIIVVAILVSPFFFIETPLAALGGMFVFVFLIIICVSYYLSVLFDRNFARQTREMVLFSIGVAAVAFAIGTLFRKLTGIDL